MPAVLELSAQALRTAIPSKRTAEHLRAYRFQPGHEAIRREDGTTGRPKGTKDALTVIAESAPHKAKQYVKSTAPAVLVDARKWIMPIDSDKSVSVADAQPVLAFLAQHLTIVMAAPPTTRITGSVEPQPVSLAAAPTASPSATSSAPTLQPAHTVAVTLPERGEPATLTPSAGTEQRPG